MLGTPADEIVAGAGGTGLGGEAWSVLPVRGGEAWPASATAPSASRVHSDSSDWTAVTGWIACASAACAAVTSERPSRRTLPAATSSLSAAQVSASGTSGSTRCR